MMPIMVLGPWSDARTVGDPAPEAIRVPILCARLSPPDKRQIKMPVQKRMRQANPLSS